MPMLSWLRSVKKCHHSTLYLIVLVIAGSCYAFPIAPVIASSLDIDASLVHLHYFISLYRRSSFITIGEHLRSWTIF